MTERPTLWLRPCYDCAAKDAEIARLREERQRYEHLEAALENEGAHVARLSRQLAEEHEELRATDARATQAEREVAAQKAEKHVEGAWHRETRAQLEAAEQRIRALEALIGRVLDDAPRLGFHGTEPDDCRLCRLHQDLCAAVRA